MKLYESAVRRPVTFVMLFIVLVVLGVVSLVRLSPELLPDLSFPTITVIVRYEGVGPEDIENLITRPIENAVSTVNRVKEVTSESREGVSQVSVSFEWGTNMDLAAVDVREKVDMTKRFLPEDAETPMVIKLDPSMFPIAFYGLSGDIGQYRLRELADDRIVPALERADGVASVDVMGGIEREVQINLDRRRMDALGLTIGQIAGAVAQENLDLPAGSVDENRKEYLLRALGQFGSVDEIEDILVSTRDGSPVYLRDIAEVRDGHQERQSISRIRGKPGVMVMLRKRSGANTVTTMNKVAEEVERIRRTLPQGVELAVLRNSADFITDTINNLWSVAWQGGLLAIFVILFFLRDVRSSFIISLSIPISIIACFTALYFAGITLNMMSLGGLALAIGMLVDNSVVVLENVFRHRRENREPGREAAIWGTSEVALPIMASTLTTIVVFLPVFFIPGIARQLFQEQALTVILSLLVSLFVALTLVPLMASRLLSDKAGRENAVSRAIERLFSGLIAGYGNVLTWALHHRVVVLAATLVLFGVSVAAVVPLRLVGTEFMPKVDQSNMDISLEMPVGTRIEVTEEMTKRIEAIVRERVPELKFVRSRIGSGGFFGGGGRSGSHAATISIELVGVNERERSSEEISASLRAPLNRIPGIRYRMSGHSGMRLLSMGGGDAISVEIYGHDLDKALDVAQRVHDIVEATPGAVDPHISLDKSKPEMQMRIDRKRVADVGLTVASVSQAVQGYVQGTTAGMFREGGDEYPITVRLRERDRKNIEDILSVPLVTPAGQKVSLRTVADFELAAGPTSISRKEQERMVSVTANYAGRDLGAVTRAIEEQTDALVLPSGFDIRMGGEVKEQRESFFWLGLALIGAVFLVYAVMASQFESLLDPFIILFTVPLALIGVIWFYFFTNTTINIIGLIGVILLVGIIVNNGIVLVDYMNLLRARGYSLFDAVVQGGKDRLRPVLMTAVTTIVGLIPMALGIGEGAEFQAPLARAVVGGLTAGTFLTLVFIPVLYSMFESLSARMKRS